MTNRKPKRFTAFLWHRRIGLIAFVLVIILAITGIMLNHTEVLKLDKTYINKSWLLNWYGIKPEGNPVSYKVDSHTISFWHQHLFFDGKDVLTTEQTIHGAIATQQFYIVAFDSKLVLLSKTGELVEQVDTATRFSGIRRLGIEHKRPVIETSKGLYYIADQHILDWAVITAQGVNWSKTYRLNHAEHQRLLLTYQGNGLKLERIILDLHSGRIFGQYGIYLMDAAAIALLWLSLSGLWVWNSRRRKMRQKRHFQQHHRN